MKLRDWKQLVITQEVLAELKKRVESLKDSLVQSAGVDPRLDSYRSGAIAALQDVINFQFDDEETHGN